MAALYINPIQVSAHPLGGESTVLIIAQEQGHCGVNCGGADSGQIPTPVILKRGSLRGENKSRRLWPTPHRAPSASRPAAGDLSPGGGSPPPPSPGWDGKVSKRQGWYGGSTPLGFFSYEKEGRGRRVGP